MKNPEKAGRRTVDVVIPVYRPNDRFVRVLRGILKQSYPADRIILINTERKYFDEKRYRISDRIEVYHIRKEAFDHGRTRHEGMKLATADYVLMMTMDALPADDFLIERLIEGIRRRGERGEIAAVSYARQIALPEHADDRIERYARSFNYPGKSRVKTIADLENMGIKTFFCSDVCALYDRRIYFENGGFRFPMIFNEDMVYAAAALNGGYAVSYQARAKVFHSHHYTCAQQFRRSFDMGVSHADCKDVFEGVSSEKEGVQLLKKTARVLIREGQWGKLPGLAAQCGAKYLGYRMGKSYRKFRRETVLRMTQNRSYWEQQQRECGTCDQEQPKAF